MTDQVKLVILYGTFNFYDELLVKYYVIIKFSTHSEKCRSKIVAH